MIKLDAIVIAIVALILSCFIYMGIEYCKLPDTKVGGKVFTVSYVHVSGKTMDRTIRVSEDVLGLRAGLCQGAYVMYQVTKSGEGDICKNVLVHGVTEIIGFKKIED